MGQINTLFHTAIGYGEINAIHGQYELTLPQADRDRYSDAQVTSYRSPSAFTYHPPLRMTVRAYAQGDLQGTAGFGFWNHPFEPGSKRLRLPKAVWFFFASPPSNMALAQNISGYGWKAATFDATRPLFLALLPTAPIGFLLMRVPIFYRHLWPIAQQAIGVSEYRIASTMPTAAYTYQLEWHRDRVKFAIDGDVILETPNAPHGPLGFIAWIDNQYAVITPQGQFGFGLLELNHPQSLILEQIHIESL